MSRYTLKLLCLYRMLYTANYTLACRRRRLGITFLPIMPLQISDPESEITARTLRQYVPDPKHLSFQGNELKTTDLFNVYTRLGPTNPLSGIDYPRPRPKRNVSSSALIPRQVYNVLGVKKRRVFVWKPLFFNSKHYSDEETKAPSVPTK
jgi:hypothetical protein